MWTLYLVTESGREIPHWTARTREACRAARRTLAHEASRKVRSVIRSHVFHVWRERLETGLNGA